MGPIGVIVRLYGGYIGIMEKKKETTTVYWDKIRVILGLYRDEIKWNYYLGFRVYGC